MELNRIYLQECLEGMNKIDEKSIDMILCDLPYGTTDCEWDNIIPFDKLWEQYERIIKEAGVICLFASQPFTSKLVMSNLKMFKYEYIWQKEQGVNFQLAKKQPLKITESILVFYKKFQNYNPIGVKKINKTKTNKNKGGGINHLSSNSSFYVQEYTNYPTNLLKFNREVGIHPTQKPVSLCEYLIKTYTKENDIVLDNCMGSGTTAIACMNTNRNFIGFETNEEYYNKSIERINNQKEKLKPTKKLSQYLIY